MNRISKMKKKLLTLLMVSVLLITMPAGCGLGSTGGSESTQNCFRYACTNYPSTLDPTLCNGITENEFQHVLTEGLTRSSGGVVKPGIAESWDISEDGTVYTFHLRDAVWSDGQPITAYDYLYSWQRLADPATKSDYAFAAWIIKGGKAVNVDGASMSELGVKVIDKKTLQVTLERPTAYFLSYIGGQPSFAPVRKDYVEKYGDKFATSPETNVYSGPFTLTGIGENTWEFTRNPDFWDAENISIESALAYYPEEEESQIEMFENGELDLAFIPNNQVNKYRKQPNVNHYLNGTVDYCYINDKCDNPALKNRNFRCALNYSLNRKLYNHNANDDAYKAYNALVFPGLNGKDGVTYGEVYNVDLYAYPIEGDVDLAREYLKEAMIELKVKSASDISIEFTAPDTEENRRVGDELKAQWEDILGINVNLRYIERAKIYNTVYPSGDYEIGLTGWGPDYNDPYTYLEIWRTDNTSYTPYSNPELDAQLDAAIAEPDPDLHMDKLYVAERMIIDEAACIPLECKDKYYMINPRVSNLTLTFCNITIDWAYASLKE